MDGQRLTGQNSLHETNSLRVQISLQESRGLRVQSSLQESSNLRDQFSLRLKKGNSLGLEKEKRFTLKKEDSIPSQGDFVLALSSKTYDWCHETGRKEGRRECRWSLLGKLKLTERERGRERDDAFGRNLGLCVFFL
ncbi:hypothetical protein F511_28420 [Dorcoceras hygrometricum]|uniref:Uncharacterized protein n=1 Tax=Dorcoceras hygrometricum TaxID=472368 RepID=A0A2Z7AH00_9LAMI|nr:hypothetical protein F511_28420 [Dorcoceras hygrometricum]